MVVERTGNNLALLYGRMTGMGVVVSIENRFVFIDALTYLRKGALRYTLDPGV